MTCSCGLNELHLHVGHCVEGLKAENERLRVEVKMLKAITPCPHKPRIEAALALIERYLSLPGCPDMLSTALIRTREALKGEE